MKTFTTIVMYLVVGIIMIMLGGLAGWYLFLRTKIQETTAVDSARGLNTAVPSFTGDTGSTANNIAASQPSGVQRIASSSSAPVSNGVSLGRLWKVDKTPVAGFAWGASASSTAFFFIERANGNLFLADTKTQTVSRKTATLLPKIYEARIASDGSALLRSVDATGTVTTFIGSISSTTVADATSDSTLAPLSFTGDYIANNISAITLNPISKSYFYLTSDAGSTTGTLVQWNNPKAKPQTLFTSPLSGWIPHLTADGRIILATSPADGYNGYAYQLQKDGSLTSLIRRVPGLTILPNDTNQAMLYSSATGGSMNLSVQTTMGSSTPLGLKTIADKCVWAHHTELPISARASSTATSTKKTKPAPVHGHLIAYCAVPISIPASKGFLGEWLRGTLHTADAWWKIDVTAGSSTLIYTPKTDTTEQLDVQNPSINEADTQIVFINNRDQSLWVFNVVQ